LEFTLHLSALEEQTKIKDLVIEDQQKEIIELKAQVETYKKIIQITAWRGYRKFTIKRT